MYSAGPLSPPGSAEDHWKALDSTWIEGCRNSSRCQERGNTPDWRPDSTTLPMRTRPPSTGTQYETTSLALASCARPSTWNLGPKFRNVDDRLELRGAWMGCTLAAARSTLGWWVALGGGQLSGLHRFLAGREGSWPMKCSSTSPSASASALWGRLGADGSRTGAVGSILRCPPTR